LWIGMYQHAGEMKAENIMTTESMVYPWLRMAAKIVPDSGEIVAVDEGIIYVVLCNRAAWIARRHIYVHLTVDGHELNIDHKMLI